MNDTTNTVTSKDWLEGAKGIVIRSYVESYHGSATENSTMPPSGAGATIKKVNRRQAVSKIAEGGA